MFGCNVATIHCLRTAYWNLPLAQSLSSRSHSQCPHKISKATDVLKRRDVLKTPNKAAAELQRNNLGLVGNLIAQHSALLSERAWHAFLAHSRKCWKGILISLGSWTVSKNDESLTQYVKVTKNKSKGPKRMTRYNHLHTMKIVKLPDYVMVLRCCSGAAGKGT